MFKWLKLYNYYVIKQRNNSSLNNANFKKLPMHFKWINNFFIKDFDGHLQSRYFKQLRRYLSTVKRRKKYKKYNFFKYSILKYRRFIKVNRWLQINNHLFKRTNLPIVKKPKITYSESLFKYSPETFSFSHYNLTKSVNLISFFEFNKAKKRSYFFKSNSKFIFKKLINRCIVQYDIDLKINTFKKKYSKLARYKSFVLRRNNKFKVRTLVNSIVNKKNEVNLTNYIFKQNNTRITDYRKLVLYTMYNTYNSKTINWRIVN